MEATSNINERRPYYKEAGKALREISVNLVFAFIFTALFFKHSGYSNEGEYRF